MLKVHLHLIVSECHNNDYITKQYIECLLMFLIAYVYIPQMSLTLNRYTHSNVNQFVLLHTRRHVMMHGHLDHMSLATLFSSTCPCTWAVSLLGICCGHLT